MELRNSLRLGVLLVGLVAVNVYVFLFNHGTAPRDVLHLQSTSKVLDESRHKPPATDPEKARLIAAASPATPSAGAPPAAPEAAPTSAPAVNAPAAPQVLPARARGASPPVVLVPWAPPNDPVTGAPRAPGGHPIVQVPWAPPPEDDGPAQVGPVEKKFGAADTLGQVLAREGFGGAGTNVIAVLSKLVDPKTIRGGQKYLVRLDDEGTPDSFEYVATPVLRYIVERGDDGAWKARKVEQAVDLRTAEIGGVVDSSLYESVQKAGESTALVSLLVELFAWDVNFYTDTHPGDHWKVVVEKQYLGGQYYKYGRLLAAEYGGRTGTFRAFYWAPKSGASGAPGKYYDEHGQSVSKSMLKTPLRYVRISSKFDRKRFHPILHVERAHLGIDYAAPAGTPVWASASGRVVEVGMKRGSGNTVVLAHANGLSTRYYHLSRYAHGLHVGQLIKQKDVIGFVGMTGLATGPHLHFSVTKNGAFVDPSKLQVGRDAPVPDRGAFLEGIRPRLAALKSIQPAAVARN